MKERFGDWGADLSEADFACALAAAGVVGSDPNSFGPNLTDIVSLIEFRAKWSLGHSVWLPWTFNREVLFLTAGILAEAWRRFQQNLQYRRYEITLIVEPRSLTEEGIDSVWVQEQLSRPEVGALVAIRKPEKKRVMRVPPSYAIDQEPETDSRKTGYPAEGAYSIKDDESPVDRSYRSHYQTEEVREPIAAYERTMAVRKDQAPPRYLQARLRSGSRDVKTLRGAGSYLAIIRIGHSKARWVSVEQPFPTPEEPPKREGHWLTVIFREPRVSDTPQVQRLLLPPKGNTQEVSFPFEIPPGLKKIAARITVLHANRVLQTGLLRASVGGKKPWTFTLDATPRTRLVGLSNRRQFDVALVLNHDDEGTAQGTAISGDQAVPIPLKESSVDDLTRALGDQISKIAANPKRYESLRSEGTEELLRNLAQHGGGLYQQLSGCYPLAKLDEADAQGRQACLYLTSARPDSFFPVELVYRYDVPEDTARLCEHALSALTEGSCPTSCPSDKSQTVCPLGFWGLSRVIERHSFLVQPDKPTDGFRLQSEPVLPRSLLDISGKALLAASDVASKYENGAVEGLLQRLRQRGPAELASSWQEWSERVKTDRPTLLVLLPHHERRDGFEILEIGAADALKSVLVKKKHVRVEDKDRPIVLLMGCGTNLARIAFENFVGSFILQGAAIVVSTIATILGRHASPATAHLIELLDEEAGEGGSSFGEVMVRLRRKLLTTETPMALGLTAYGDADWILTRKADADDRDAPRPLR